MATIKPFRCIRPTEKLAEKVAALPYDVYNRAEAKEAVKGNSLSFLNIDRPETQFGDEINMYDPMVYEKARELLDTRINDGTFITDRGEHYYIYELIMNGRSQTGIVACASIDDYLHNVIKKHENTREEKELDRICHVDACSAQTGPIFLAYRSDKVIAEIVNKTKKTAPLYAFTSDDGITHNVWRIDDKDDTDTIRGRFEKIDSIYIADGHHRAASAVKVGLKRRAHKPGYTGKEEFNFFLSVLFPEDQLMIMPYNRVVADICNMTTEEYIKAVGINFEVKMLGKEQYAPKSKGTFGMYIDKCWYELKVRCNILNLNDPVEVLDVSILQNYLLKPVLKIDDPRTDKRIDFIGGIRGLNELERRADSDMRVAFSMYPTSIQELFAVSDAGLLMPPKSTWFEPKLRSGLFIHDIE